MSSLQPVANSTKQYQTPQEVMMFGMLSVGTSCSFLYIDSVLLYTLRSKQVFCETSRYVLLYNLLFADTVQMATSLLLYFLASLRVKISYYTCGFLVMLTIATGLISPLTLAVMSLERYVAVCHPLRHASIFTMRSTGVSIALVWTFSFLHVLIRVSILLYLFTKIPMREMDDFCSREAIFFAPLFYDFEKVFGSTVFLLVGLAILGSFVGVALITRSVSTDKASAKKALQTLLLHLIQLSLILTASFYSTILLTITKTLGRIVLMRVYNVCFVFLFILPRCLSALIYGLRDQNLRPIILQNLFCCWNSGFFGKNQ